MCLASLMTTWNWTSIAMGRTWTLPYWASKALFFLSSLVSTWSITLKADHNDAFSVDEGAILDAVFEKFNHPTPSGFERIMIEKALLWWMYYLVCNKNQWPSHLFKTDPQGWRRTCCDDAGEVVWWTNLHFPHAQMSQNFLLEKNYLTVKSWKTIHGGDIALQKPST